LAVTQVADPLQSQLEKIKDPARVEELDLVHSSVQMG